MKTGTIARVGAAAGAALLAAGIVAPYLRADQFGENIRQSLQRALGRRVDIGKVRFNLFQGPGFEVEDVVIHEDPSVGIEPMARVGVMEVRPRWWTLLGGHLAVGSILLDGAHINLSKTGAPSEPGRWNFDRLLRERELTAFPGVRIRNGRVNFKFGDTKSGFYLLGADLDISPPRSGREWRISCEGQPARTDRPALGLGSFTARGKWIAAPEGGKLDLDLRLDRTGLGEITALLRGSDAGVHGTVSARLRLAGPLRDIRIAGRMNIEDVHRWDLLPPRGEGWPLDVRGRLDLVSQLLELESNSAENVPLPLFARFRMTGYLSQPRWGVSVNWNSFPVEPLLELARHMGAQLPARLKLTGSIQGAIGYSGQGSFQGQMNFEKTVLTVPDSPPLRFDTASVLFGQGHVYLKPALVRVSENETAQLEADYAAGAATLDLQISTEGMDVGALRSQAALAAVPWLEQLRAGRWRGQLHYRAGPGAPEGWTGKATLSEAEIPVAGIEGPLRIETARASIDHARVVLDRIEGSVGDIAFNGEYRFEPQAARPHRVRLAVEELDAAALEERLAPTLRRSGNLVLRALGRAALPDWLKSRAVEGTVRIGSLQLGGAELENVQAHLLWDGARAELNGVQARVAEGALTGRLTVNLRGSSPSYRFTGRARGVAWQSGKMDLEGALETSGTGAQLLARLNSSGTFSGTGLELGGPAPLRSAAGSYRFAMARTAPRLSFTDLELSTADDTYTGRGETQEDGRLVLLLTNGSREMRMSGALTKLRIDDSSRQ
jgi:hypothetical protein